MIFNSDSQSSHNGDLLVDFPQRQAAPSGSLCDRDGLKRAQAETPKKSHRRHRKRVGFSQTSTLSLFEPNTKQENKLAWYSHKDREVFKMERKLDIKRIADEPLEGSDPLEFLGIENFLSKKVVKKVYKKRVAHLEAVLEAQDHMRRQGYIDDEELCQVSESHSEWSKEVSLRLAVRYINMDLD